MAVAVMSPKNTHRAGTMAAGVTEAGDETQTEHDEALGPFHEPAFGREAEKFGFGPLIGDQSRQGQDGEGQEDELSVVVRHQVPRHAAEEEGVGDPVGHRVEEGTANRRRARRLGHRSVEEVGEAGRKEQDGAR